MSILSKGTVPFSKSYTRFSISFTVCGSGCTLQYDRLYQIVTIITITDPNIDAVQASHFHGTYLSNSFCKDEMLLDMSVLAYLIFCSNSNLRSVCALSFSPLKEDNLSSSLAYSSHDIPPDFVGDCISISLLANF